MYEELTTLLNESIENKEVLMFALTANGDFFSSGNDIMATMESTLTFAQNTIK